jgi:hypothetical protein
MAHCGVPQGGMVARPVWLLPTASSESTEWCLNRSAIPGKITLTSGRMATILI